MSSINVLRKENSKCIEWNLRERLCDLSRDSALFSIQDHYSPCFLHFYFGPELSDNKYSESRLYFKTENGLHSPRTIAVHVWSDSITLQKRKESILRADDDSWQVIWSYSQGSLTDRLLTFEVTIYSDSSTSKNPMIMPICVESLLEDFGKLLESRKHSDVVLKCGEKTFPAHRSILSARSDVFSAMFQNKFSESESGIVTIEDVDPSILDYFLRYVYSGKLEAVNMDTAIDLYKVADKYAMSSFKRKCSSLIETRFTEDNVCSILLMADQYPDQELFEAAMVYAVNRNDFLKSEQWDAFSEEHERLAVKVYKRFMKK